MCRCMHTHSIRILANLHSNAGHVESTNPPIFVRYCFRGAHENYPKLQQSVPRAPPPHALYTYIPLASGASGVEIAHPSGYYECLDPFLASQAPPVCSIATSMRSPM